MACRGCGDKSSDRYETTHIGEPEGGHEPHIHQDPRKPPYDELFKEVNKFSLDTLLKMRDDVRYSEEDGFREMLKYMSEDLIALKILTFVKIVNGEEFSKDGHSPQYCLEMLNSMLNFEESSYIFDRFEGLKEQIKEKYLQLVSGRIKIDLK